MLSFTLGPLALPVLPLLWLAAVWAASWGAQHGATRRPGVTLAQAQHAGQAVTWAALVGGCVARLAHVAAQADVYARHPWRVLDVRDGGAWPALGVLAAALFLLLWLRRRPLLRRPVWGACALSAMAAGALGLSLGVWQAPPPVAVPVQALAGGPPQTLHLGAPSALPRVVNLWASWCGPCRQEMPLLAQAQRQEAGRVAFVFVNQGESAAAVRAYLVDQDLALASVWLDAAAGLGPAVGSRGLPTTLFYAADGRLVARHFGVLSPVALETRLRELGLAPERPAATAPPSSSF